MPSESLFCHEDPAKLIALFSIFFEVRCNDRPQNALARASDECEVFHAILQGSMGTSEGAKNQVDRPCTARDIVVRIVWIFNSETIGVSK